jgi:predicted dehydrogenase
MAKMVTGPRLMQFSRLSPYTPRIRESIVFDLMVHDLDLACMFAGSAPERVVAGGIRVWSDTLDAASAILTFPNGCVSSVTASRITQDKVRRITVSEDERYFEGDCLRQELCIKRETHGEFTADAGYRQASVVEIPSLDRRAEPLMLELRSFVEAMRGEAEIRVSGRAGAAAVRLAHQVETMASSA